MEKQRAMVTEIITSCQFKTKALRASNLCFKGSISSFVVPIAVYASRMHLQAMLSIAAICRFMLDNEAS
eukprot:39736-Amphidinium_carterae.1